MRVVRLPPQLGLTLVTGNGREYVLRPPPRWLVSLCAGMRSSVGTWICMRWLWRWCAPRAAWPHVFRLSRYELADLTATFLRYVLALRYGRW